MIVTINSENSDKYYELFRESYEYLKELDKGYVDPDKKRFGSLAEYYSHMADFFDNHKYKYIMLPLDEEAFKINLNTRSIEVPASFSKCASVQSDQLAETIIFEADRYFDYMDLANTEIYVQWTIPEDKKNGVKEFNGATRVEMVDLDTVKGKLRFAWPLNDTVTRYPGIVKFSVRFFRIDDSDPNKLLYSLNTTDTYITIKPALQPKLTDSAFLEAPISDNSFKKAILNSNFATEGVNEPVLPEFFAPGSNITANTGIFEVGTYKVANLNQNTITLYVQAYTADTSEVMYKWFYQAGDGDYRDCEKYEEIGVDKDGNPTYSTFGTVNHDTYLECNPQPTKRVAHEIYYQKIGNSMQEYTDIIPAKDTDGNTITLYERYSSFTVPAGDVNVTGNYQAAAWGYVELANGKVLTTQYPRRSDVCLIPGPSTILFKTDGNLVAGKILEPREEGEGFETSLTVSLETDPYQPSIEYLWRRSVTVPESVLDINNADYYEIAADVNADIFKNDVYFTLVNSVFVQAKEFDDTMVYYRWKEGAKNTGTNSSLKVEEPGWYSVEVISTLNREAKHQLSSVCKVTNMPKPPIVESQASVFVDITNTTKENPQKFTIKTNLNNPDNYNKEILTDEVDESGNIKSFTYVWQMQIPDSEKYITIKEGTVGIDGLGTDTLRVDKRLNHLGATFRCLVVNNLNGKKAVFDHSGRYDGKDPSLGQFEAKAPYIYEDPTLYFDFSVRNY